MLSVCLPLSYLQLLSLHTAAYLRMLQFEMLAIVTLSAEVLIRVEVQEMNLTSHLWVAGHHLPIIAGTRSKNLDSIWAASCLLQVAALSANQVETPAEIVAETLTVTLTDSLAKIVADSFEEMLADEFECRQRVFR